MKRLLSLLLLIPLVPGCLTPKIQAVRSADTGALPTQLAIAGTHRDVGAHLSFYLTEVGFSLREFSHQEYYPGMRFGDIDVDVLREYAVDNDVEAFVSGEFVRTQATGARRGDRTLYVKVFDARSFGVLAQFRYDFEGATPPEVPEVVAEVAREMAIMAGLIQPEPEKERKPRPKVRKSTWPPSN